MSSSEPDEKVALLACRAQRIEGKSEDLFWFASKSKAMEKVNEEIAVLRKANQSGQKEQTPILIVGECGTGTQGIARMIHASGDIACPWIAFNCAAQSEVEVPLEFLGSEPGAMPKIGNLKRGLFELATHGTLFLENVDHLSSSGQEVLYQSLSKKSFRRQGGTLDQACNFRLIVTSEVDWGAAREQGKFHPGLAQILSQRVLKVPPLRERKEDLLMLANHFATRCFESNGKVFPGFASEAELVLSEYSWPGNDRELFHVIERVSLIWKKSGLIPSLSLYLPEKMRAPISISGNQSKLRLVQSMDSHSAEVQLGYTEIKKNWSDAFEKNYLIEILNRNGGNVSAAAREAKLDRSNFLRLLRRHELKAQDYRKAAA